MSFVSMNTIGYSQLLLPLENHAEIIVLAMWYE